MSIQKLQTTWEGIRPIVFHNGQLADPSNHIVRKIKELTSKRGKTDADHEAVSRLEWEGSLYLGAKGQLVVPSDNIERAIQLGGQKSKIGKSIAAAVFCTEPEIDVQYSGPKTLNALYDNPLFVLKKGVKVTTSRIIRTRPMIPPGWKLTFQLEFDASVINESALVKAMIEAGALIGIGDWRPKFGRFLVK